ncbi:MAG: hypothetical protein ACOYN1_01050 [Polynucleobacter sp.]
MKLVKITSMFYHTTIPSYRLIKLVRDKHAYRIRQRNQNQDDRKAIRGSHDTLLSVD